MNIVWVLWLSSETLKGKLPNGYQLTTSVSKWKQEKNGSFKHVTLVEDKIDWFHFHWMSSFTSNKVFNASIQKRIVTCMLHPMWLFYKLIIKYKITLIKSFQKFYNALQHLMANHGNVCNHVSYEEASPRLTIKVAKKHIWYSSNIPILIIELLRNFSLSPRISMKWMTLDFLLSDL